jgi:hypothetical protein
MWSRKLRRFARRRIHALSALGEPAHSAKIYIGRNVNSPNGTVLYHLSDKKVLELSTEVAKATTGGVTISNAKGRYVSVDTGEAWPVEDSVVINSVIPDGPNASCRRVIKRAQRVGQRVANMGRQQSVLVEVRCANGHQDASLVRWDGKKAPLFPLVPVEKSRQRKAKAKVKRRAGRAA